VRHPICTCIVYLAAEVAGGGTCSASGSQQAFVGGPTLATDQVLGGPLATKGWLAYPASNRVLCFDGRFLHGACDTWLCVQGWGGAADASTLWRSGFRWFQIGSAV
jgi:hypothetical protein